MIDLTVCVGIDGKTFEQLKLSWRTWYANRRELWLRPWLLFYDPSQVDGADVAAFINLIEHPLVTPVRWPETMEFPYQSQREKMLTGHVIVPALYARSEWCMKIDTDVLARPHAQWLNESWFAPNGDQLPAYVAPRWHYTKGKGFLAALDDWGDGLYELSHYPRLNIPADPDSLRVGHSRMCSWVSYYRTAYLRTVAGMCRVRNGWKLPVPSQDTVAWYVAERQGRHRVIANQKALGWSNHSRLADLSLQASEIILNWESCHAEDG